MENVENLEPKPVEEQPPVETAETAEVIETLPEVPPEVRTFKFVADGEEIEKSEEELIDLARQGINYTKKSQALSDWEKSIQDKVRQYDSLAQDPITSKFLAARMANFDPSVLFTEPTPPPPSMKDYDPEIYYEMYNRYQAHKQQKEAAEALHGQLVQTNAASHNNALVQKSRIDHPDLTEGEFNQIVQFVQSNFQVNALGMYNTQAMDWAFNALFGNRAAEKGKLNQANKINKIIQEGVKSPPLRSTSQKSEKGSMERPFLEYVVATSSKE